MIIQIVPSVALTSKQIEVLSHKIIDLLTRDSYNCIVTVIDVNPPKSEGENENTSHNK